ncbi:MAG: YidB family protein [Asticcacaulis sp.]
MAIFDEILGGLGGKLDLEGLAGQFGGEGLSGIVSQLQQGGLGDAVQSWISTGGNLPVSADQLQAVLGNETVGKLAGSLGIDPSQLASALPGLIDKLSPNGQLPANLGEALPGLLGNSGLGNMLGGLFK